MLLDFANAKRLDPRVTFTRASTARYYDGSTVAKAEENLLLQSQTFDNASWTKVNSSVNANAAVAPDGQQTAERLLIAAGQAVTTSAAGLYSSTRFAYLTQSTGTLLAATYTASMYIKADTTFTHLQIRIGTTSDLATGVAAALVKLSDGTTSDPATVTDAGNGWWRVSFSFTATAVQHFIGVWFWNATSIASTAGTESVLIWGAQLEQRSAVTAYTATTTAPITNYIPVLQTAASGQARFDHNPVTGESLGLLIEESRTNLVTYSEQFNDASWAKTNSTVQSNTAIAPDGTLTSDSFLDVNAGAYAEIRRVLAFTSGTAYSFSVYAKAATRRYLYLSLGTRFASATEAIFDLQTGVVKSQGVGATTATISSVGNGFYRCAITATANSTGNGEAYFYHTNDAGTSIFYTGTGTGSIFLWGAQVEAGAFPTSYIQTVAASATRQADAASMTGANFTSWFDATEGTLFADVIIGRDSDGSRFFANIDDGTNQNAIDIRSGSISTIGGVVSFNNVQQANLASTAPAIGDRARNALAYRLNDFAFCCNAQTVATDTSGNLPVGTNRFSIGSYSAGAGNFVNTTIAKISYYPVRLPDAQLQALTR